MSVQRWSEYVDGMVISPTGHWVTYADHVAALAEAEQQFNETLNRLGKCNGCQEDLDYCRAEALREAREAVSAPTLHDDACCSRGCTRMHSDLWEQAQRIHAALGFPVTQDDPPPPECDGSCNCTAAPFIAAIDALGGSDG